MEEQVMKERVWEEEQGDLKKVEDRWRKEALSEVGLKSSISVTWMQSTKERGKMREFLVEE